MKIVIAGPKEAGKSTISNFLSGQTESLVVSDYLPTEGVRFVTVVFELLILSFEQNP